MAPEVGLHQRVGNEGGFLICFDAGTGKDLWSERRAQKGSLVMADGRLYLRAERGDMILIEPNRERYVERGRFKQPERSEEPAWTHPVIANGKLYVADTNNQAVRVVDLKLKQTSTLNIKGLQPPATAPVVATENETGPNAEEIKVAAQQVREHAKGELVINVELPAGYHLNPAAPQRYRVDVETGPKHFGFFSATALGAIGRDSGGSKTAKDLKLPIRIPFQAFEAGAARLRLTTHRRGRTRRPGYRAGARLP